MIYSTHHSVEPFHLDRYLDETVLRSNTRKMTDAGWFSLTAARTAGRRITYAELTGKVGPAGATA